MLLTRKRFFLKHYSLEQKREGYVYDSFFNHKELLDVPLVVKNKTLFTDFIIFFYDSLVILLDLPILYKYFIFLNEDHDIFFSQLSGKVTTYSGHNRFLGYLDKPPYEKRGLKVDYDIAGTISFTLFSRSSFSNCCYGDFICCTLVYKGKPSFLFGEIFSFKHPNLYFWVRYRKSVPTYIDKLLLKDLFEKGYFRRKQHKEDNYRTLDFEDPIKILNLKIYSKPTPDLFIKKKVLNDNRVILGGCLHPKLFNNMKVSLIFLNKNTKEYFEISGHIIKKRRTVSVKVYNNFDILQTDQKIIKLLRFPSIISKNYLTISYDTL